MHPAPARPWLGLLRGCMSAQSRKPACLVSPARRVTREGAERDRQKARNSLSAPVPWARMLADKFSALKYGKQPCGHQSRLNHAVRHLSRTIMMVSPPAVTSLASMTVRKAIVSSRTNRQFLAERECLLVPRCPLSRDSRYGCANPVEVTSHAKLWQKSARRLRRASAC